MFSVKLYETLECVRKLVSQTKYELKEIKCIQEPRLDVWQFKLTLEYAKRTYYIDAKISAISLAQAVFPDIVICERIHAEINKINPINDWSLV